MYLLLVRIIPVLVLLLVNVLRFVLQLLRTSHWIFEHILAGAPPSVSVIQAFCNVILLESSPLQ